MTTFEKLVLRLLTRILIRVIQLEGKDTWHGDDLLVSDVREYAQEVAREESQASRINRSVTQDSEKWKRR